MPEAPLLETRRIREFLSELMKKPKILTLLAGGASCLAWALLRVRPRFLLTGKTVVITGGSRGLGLQLAREFGSRGARVVICARGQSELERAVKSLAARGISAHALQCDVSDREQCRHLIEEAARLTGTLDVLVNNAGIIQVGPASAMEIADFEEAMGTMFWGPLYLTLAALPHLRRNPESRIVNITSVGGKMAVPHLLPYCCAKFAAVALSQGLRTELAPHGIKVTTVVPGLMRTGSHVNAHFKGDHAKEYAWFSLSAATPVLSIDAARSARAIVHAAIRGDAEKILSVPADIAARVNGALPELTAPLFDVVNRLLPADGVNASEKRTGRQAAEELNSGWLEMANVLGTLAAESLNQFD